MNNPLIGDLGALLFSCDSDGKPSVSSFCGDTARTPFEFALQRYKETLLKNGIQWPTDSDKRECYVFSALATHTHHELRDLVVSLIGVVEDLSKKDEDDGNSIGDFYRNEARRGSSMSGSAPHVFETRELNLDVDIYGRRVINRYILISELGRGAYGSVLFAKDRDTNTNVAIKMVSKSHLKIPTGGKGKALPSEITVMKKLRHRNCVSLLEVIDAPGSSMLYLVMEYMPYGPVVCVQQCLEGEPSDVFRNTFLLQKVTKEGVYFGCRPLPEDLCAQYLKQLVCGLQYLHDRGVIHHDIKPDNILRGEGDRVCFSDFGVSEIVNQIPNMKVLTGVRSGVATPLFSAPEQFEGSLKVDPDVFMTDIWALGVTLYIMLVGVAPFSGVTYFAVANDIKESIIPWNGYNVRDEKLSNHWKTILDGMLAKKPQDRWSLEKLKDFLEKKYPTSDNPLSPTLEINNAPQFSLPLEGENSYVDTTECVKDHGAFSHSFNTIKVGSLGGTYKCNNTESSWTPNSEIPTAFKTLSSEEVHPAVVRRASRENVRHDQLPNKGRVFQRAFDKMIFCGKKRRTG